MSNDGSLPAPLTTGLKNNKQVMFMKFLILLVLLSSPPVFAGGADVIGNGGGVGEQNVVLAWQILPTLLSELASQDQTLAKTYLKSFDHVYGADFLLFRSGINNPGLFPMDAKGLAVAATTQGWVGAPIYFNLDRITVIEDGSLVYAMSVDEALSLEVDLIGKAHGTPEGLGSELADLRERVVDLGRRTTVKADARVLFLPQVVVFSKNSTSINNPVYLVVGDGEARINLSEDLVKILSCKPSFKARPVAVQGLYWLDTEVDPKNPDLQPIFSQGKVTWGCVDSTNRAAAWYSATLKMKFYLKMKDAAVNLQRDSAVLSITNRTEVFSAN